MKCDDMHMRGGRDCMSWFGLFIQQDMMAFDTM